MALPTLPTEAFTQASAPYSSRTTTRTLDLTTTSTSIDLAAGVYELVVPSSAAGLVAVRHGATSAALPPSTGGTEVAGYLLTPGSVSVVYLDDATTLHARVTSGTTTLYLLRKAVS
jgi:hypothetical protein